MKSYLGSGNRKVSKAGDAYNQFRNLTIFNFYLRNHLENQFIVGVFTFPFWWFFFFLHDNGSV